MNIDPTRQDMATLHKEADKTIESVKNIKQAHFKKVDQRIEEYVTQWGDAEKQQEQKQESSWFGLFF